MILHIKNDFESQIVGNFKDPSCCLIIFKVCTIISFDYRTHVHYYKLQFVYLLTHF